MATRDQITTALLTEHLRYTPLTLLDDIINTVNELVYQAVNNIETALLSVPADQLGFTLPSSEQTKSVEDADEALEQVARTEVESGIVKLESLLNATVDKDFDKLEIYTLRNLLTVSNAKDDEGLEDWIMLDHYKNLQIDAQSQKQVAETEATTPESIHQLTRKVEETEKLQSVLRAEKERNEALLSRLRPLLSTQTHHSVKSEDVSQQDEPPSFSFLTSTPSAAALGIAAPWSLKRSTSLAQNTQFTYSQISALRSVVETLRPHLASLSSSSAVAMQISKSEEERHAYIESQAERAMERAGVEPQASIGPQEGLGRRVALDEIRALESIVGAFAADQDKMEE